MAKKLEEDEKMKINILDSCKLYAEMLSLPENERGAFFDEKFLQPFAPMLERTRMPCNPGALPITKQSDCFTIN